MGYAKAFCRRCLLPLFLILTVFPPLSLAVKSAEPTGDACVENYLLIGRDEYPGSDRSRSDSILLCTFHPQTKTLTMTSVLRDLYLPIPGHRDNRINAAYAFGGMPLLKQTLAENFRIPIDGCIEIDFASFPRLIDLLGGVTLELRPDEAEAINSHTSGTLTAGSCLLNGNQALAYVRIRKLDKDGDFGRTKRQQKLLTALLHAYRNASLPQVFRLLKEVLSLVETDMDTKEILNSARQFVPVLSQLQIRHQHIPQEGTYRYKTVRGMSVLVADLDAARALLEQTLYPPEK